MAQESLMQQARSKGAAPTREPEEAQGGAFQRPDIGQFIPEESKDAVARVVAAGMKLMYSPQMREEVQKEIQREAPVGQKLAESVTGLVLTLDQQARGGIPMEAIFPAAMELLGEAAEVLTAAGETVTQADYNDAAQRMFVLIGQKLGATEEQLMGAAEQAVSGGQPAQQAPAPEGEQEDEEMA